MDDTVNVLTERQRCRRDCAYTPDHATFGDARRCEHGNWWIATGRRPQDRYFRFFSEWRRATRREARRARNPKDT